LVVFVFRHLLVPNCSKATALV